MDFKNRTLMVTGASRGIGLAIALRLIDQGARVLDVSRSTPKNPPEGLAHVELDLADTAGLAENIRRLAENYPDIDGVVFNAGAGRFGNLEEFSPNQVQDLVRLNLISPMLIAREFVPRLKKKGNGDLVFIGSDAALRGGRKGAVYSATKFGIRGFVQSLRDECGSSGVRVGIVNPGMVDTSFFDDLNFQPGRGADQHLVAGDVASAVITMLNARAGTMVDEINLSPATHVINFGRPD